MDIKGIAIAKQMDDRRNVLRYPNGPLSPAAPIVPTADTFDTNPTNLERTTDGNFDTATGDGSKVLGGAGTVGQLIYDLGSVKTVTVGGKVGLSQNGSATVRVLVDSSQNGLDYINSTSILFSTTLTSNRIEELLAQTVTGRYIRIRIYSTAACTAVAKFYQIFAHAQGV